MNRAWFRSPRAWSGCALLATLAFFHFATPASAGARAATDWAGSRPFDASSPAGIVHEYSIQQAARSASASPPATLTGADGEWQRVAPPRGVRRLQAAMIYDPVRNRMISFGGADAGHQYTNTVYALQLSTGVWLPVATTGTPPPGRRLHHAIYDPSGDRMIVFGGWNDELLGDVWELRLSGTPHWSALSPAGGGPGARGGCGVVYDAASDRMIVFGGFDGVSEPAGRASDVWALSLGNAPEWTQLAAPGAGPSGRSSLGAAYDPVGPALLVFGGTDPEYRNDTWRFALDGSLAWSEVTTLGGPPNAREEHVLQLDPASRRLVVFGGYDESLIFDDLWRLDLTQATPVWSLASPSPQILPRWGAGSAVDGSGQLFIYGGRGWYGVLGEIRWTSIANPVAWNTFVLNLPPRLQAAMVHDTNRDRLVVFGGTDGAYQNDTYAHSMVYGTGWEPLSTAGQLPGPRRLHTGIYDPIGDRLIVFGGYDDQLLGDLWQLSFAGAATWSPLAAQGTGPSPRGGHVAIYDPETRRMIVYGGYDGVTPPGNRISDVWALSLTGTPTWTQLAPGSGPTARSSASAVYDHHHHALVLFGGTTPDYKNEAWRLSLDDPPSWTLLANDGTRPGAREEQAAAYDKKRDRMFIFGGYDMWVQNWGDLWSLDLDGGSWSQPSPAGVPPSARWGAKAIPDEGRDGMWLYGGYGYSYLNDLWFLQWYDAPSTQVMATVSAEAEPGVARLSWSAPAGTVHAAVVERSSNGTHWSVVGSTLPGTSNLLSFNDETAAPGQTLAWRARIEGAGQTLASNPAWLTMPSTTDVEPAGAVLAIGPAGQGSRSGTLAVWCSLPRAGLARLDLMDVSGRRLEHLEWSTGKGGSQRLELGRDLPAGVFFARLSFESESVGARLLNIR